MPLMLFKLKIKIISNSLRKKFETYYWLSTYHKADIPGMKKAWQIPIKNLQAIKASNRHLAMTGMSIVRRELKNIPMKSIVLLPNLVAKIPAIIWKQT